MLPNIQMVAHYNYQPLCVPGDSACHLNVHLQALYRTGNIIPAEQMLNQAMSKVRTSVEWLLEMCEFILGSSITLKLTYWEILLCLCPAAKFKHMLAWEHWFTSNKHTTIPFVNCISWMSRVTCEKFLQKVFKFPRQMREWRI